jgi:tetratricopeptide (TPR) repeat protein
MQNRSRDQYSAATDFYEAKLKTNPGMPRYTHLMAAIHSARGDNDKAEWCYRETCYNQPGNIMVRNDFAVHLLSGNRKEDARQELRKALLMVNGENAVLQKNMAAAQAKSGEFKTALETATRARYLNPDDAMNHRNLAKLHSALGDTRTALQHNLTAIRLDDPLADVKTKSSAYRLAAVQIIAKGGGEHVDAIKLMDSARVMEGKTFQLSTTVRTNEIISKIRQRKQATIENAEKHRLEALAELEKKKYDSKMLEDF